MATRRWCGPSPDAPEAAWADFVYVRDNPAGPHTEMWHHSAGCRQWFRVRRDTRTHAILGSAPPGGPLDAAADAETSA